MGGRTYAIPNGNIQWNISFTKPLHDWEVDLISSFFDMLYSSNSRSHSFVTPKMMFLKSPLDQNLIMINHKLNGDFKSHIIF
jgi:hypothetical protein